MKKQIILSAATCLLCTACGFQPMYGNSQSIGGVEQNAGVQEQLAQIEINNIPNREGQFLRNALIDRFYKNGSSIESRYTLDISEITETTYDMDITVTSDATRAQLTLSMTMTLIDNESGEETIKRSFKSSSSYNIMNSEFATRVSEQNTRENALNDLARQIELQIAQGLL